MTLCNVGPTSKTLGRRCIYRPLGYERVYLPLYKVADTPFHIQGDEMLYKCLVFAGQADFLSNIVHLFNVGSMLGQRRRR